MLCAGITVYSPIHSRRSKKGDKVGVAGLWWIGAHGSSVLVKMGADVTVLI
ncbi:MAG: hypothetical protein IPK61_07915 [Saprospiraceae bacterium]|nr:hypothetical protein [Saprospiraceae bacterium]